MVAEVVVEDVYVDYRGQRVLSKVNLTFRGAGLIQVMGPNGAGKTTLLRVILGLIKPQHGRVVVNGVDVTGRPQRAGRMIGYVPQLAILDRHYPLTVLEFVELELLLRHRMWPRLSNKETREKAARVLRAVGLDESVWSKRLVELSGGQLQRSMIARALVHDPPILVLDEPLSAVDPVGKHEISRLIARLAEKKLVILTSHDPLLLLENTSMIVLLNRAVIAAGKPEDVLREDVLRRVYGEAVIYIESYYIPDWHMAKSTSLDFS